jgi:hypothetical protein
MTASLTTSRQLPLIYQHFIVLASFATGIGLATVMSGEFKEIMTSAWRMMIIAWFPPVCLEFFRRKELGDPMMAAVLLSLLVGFNAVFRLLGYSEGC